MLSDRDAASAGPRSLKEIGSVEWCWQTLDFFKSSLRHVEEEWRQAEQVLRDIDAAQVWEKVPPSSPYGSLDAMLRAEVGLSAGQVRSRIKEARERYGGLSAVAEHGQHGNGRRRRDCGSNSTPVSGNSSEYVVARLKRDAQKDPADAALLEQVLDEEVTPNAVARRKGWRKPRIELRSPKSVAQRIRAHWNAEQIAELIRLLQEGEDGS